MRGKRVDKLAVDLDALRLLFATSELSERGVAADVCENPSSVHRFLTTGTGDAGLVTKVLVRLGVARSDIPTLIKRKDLQRPSAQLPALTTPVDYRLLESLFMVGKLDFIRRKIDEFRSSGSEGAQWADLMEAELLRWTGHFNPAVQFFTKLSQSADSVIKVYALGGQLRIAREQKDYPRCDALIEQLGECRRQLLLPPQLRAYVASFLHSIRALKFQLEGKKFMALDLIKKAQWLAHKSHLRVEPLKRMIEHGMILRKQNLRTGTADDANQAVSQYFAAFSAAEAMNSFTYMSSALNGIARISEHEATIAEQKGDSAEREAKLLEADKFLEQACQLAELSEHAGMIAIALGCRAIVKRRLGEFGMAITLSESSIAIERRMGRLSYAKIDQRNIELAKRQSTEPVSRD